MLPNQQVASRRALAKRAAEDLTRPLDRTARVRHATVEAG